MEHRRRRDAAERVADPLMTAEPYERALLTILRGYAAKLFLDTGYPRDAPYEDLARAP